VINSLKTGFDVVSNHVVLILMPLMLDVFLWLGPRLSVGKLVGPMYQAFFEQARISLASTNDAKRLAAFQDIINELLQRFNLFSLISRLQTFPVGISSLAAKIMPENSPLGTQSIVQVSSPIGMLGYMFCLVLIGWLVGGLYFRWVSGNVLGKDETGISLGRAVVQTILLSVIWFVALIVISVPILLIVTALTFISPALASGALFVMLLLSFWLIVPVYFTPHGIFIRKQNALYSIYTSLRMARFTLPTSGMFVFVVFLLSTGLNYLWSVPKSDSWMMLIGIAGHAFISTALLAASFAYYRDMNIWLQMIFEQLQQKNGATARSV
jgi:hypothetical protein